MFRILVVEQSKYDSHVGEDWDDVEEVFDDPGKQVLQEYEYRFLGIFRSVWKDVDKEIYITFDVSNPVYLDLFTRLKEQLMNDGIFLNY